MDVGVISVNDYSIAEQNYPHDTPWIEIFMNTGKMISMKEIFLRVNQYLLFTVLLVLILFYGKTFLIPITFAALLAMLMAPVCRRLDKIGFNRGLSTLVCVLILVAVIVGIGYIIGSQFAAFAEDVTLIEKKG